MAITNNVTRMLKLKKIEFKAHELPKEKLGAVEAAEYIGVSEKQVFKTIVLLDRKENSVVLAIVPGDTRVDVKAVGGILGSKKVIATSQADAETLTGLESGGISALALLARNFQVFLDKSALDFDQITISGGQRGLNISMDPHDFTDLTSGKIGNISRQLGEGRKNPNLA